MEKNVSFLVFKELLEPRTNNWEEITPEYRDYLYSLYFDFKSEIAINIERAATYFDALIYLNDLLLSFTPFEQFFESKTTNDTTEDNPKTLQSEAVKVIVYMIRKEIRVIKYLIDHQQAFENSILPKKEINSKQYCWLLSDTALLELSVALAKTRAVGDTCGKEVSPKEIAIALSSLFKIKIEYIDSKLSKAKNRKKNPAPFLTQLRNSFEFYTLDSLEK